MRRGPRPTGEKVKRRTVSLTVAVLVGLLPGAATSGDAGAQFSVRTEQYPRPPYSGATYYIYESGGAIVCTKLEVCNKFGACSASYHRGSYMAAEDHDAGQPYGALSATPIAPAKRGKHVCLARYVLGDVRRPGETAVPEDPDRLP